MKFKLGQWLASFGGSMLGLFSTGKKVKLSDVEQIAATSVIDEVSKDNQPKP